MGAGDAAAQDRHRGGIHARHPAEQHAASTVGLLQTARPHLHGHPPRHLAHRREKRKRPVRSGHRLVGDGAGARVAERTRLGGVGREMEIGEQHLAGPQHRALLGLRLLHLDDQVGLREDRSRPVGDPRAGALVVRVRESDSGTGLGLDEHLVARCHQLPNSRGHQADAVLVHLDLLRNPDPHVALLAAAASHRIP